MLWLLEKDLGIKFLMGEKVSEFKFEMARVVEGGSVAGALEMEPQN